MFIFRNYSETEGGRIVLLVTPRTSDRESIWQMHSSLRDRQRTGVANSPLSPAQPSLPYNATHKSRLICSCAPLERASVEWETSHFSSPFSDSSRNCLKLKTKSIDRSFDLTYSSSFRDICTTVCAFRPANGNGARPEWGRRSCISDNSKPDRE